MLESSVVVAFCIQKYPNGCECIQEQVLVARGQLVSRAQEASVFTACEAALGGASGIEEAVGL